tara:strand:+ start:719 stop:937 length:219 start_codon:yes stop_codon:yes gene_type:complete
VWFLILATSPWSPWINYPHDKIELTFIDEMESELIAASAALAETTQQPLTGRTAARIVALAAQITATVAKAL